jgi:hypothetical protein
MRRREAGLAGEGPQTETETETETGNSDGT